MKRFVLVLPLILLGAATVPDTNYEVTLSNHGQVIRLVDTTTDTIVAHKRLRTTPFSSATVQVKDFRTNGRYEAVVVGKRHRKNNTIYVLSISTTPARLRLKDTATVEARYLLPSRTTATAKAIQLRNRLDELIAKFRVSTQNQLTAAALGSDATRIDLGDGNYSTTTASRGSIYICNEMGDGGGAMVDGPWIHGDQWDYAEKDVTVDGAVTWENADITITTDGEDRIISSNGLPDDHPTGEFPVSSSDDAYDYDQNPNSISEQSYQLTLPTNPTASTAVNCVGGQVGISLNGVAIFNGLDATNRDAVAHEIQDTYGGHPEVQGEYHYHTISDLVAALSDREDGMTLVGYAFDGYGIYAETELNKILRTADLDQCHGHSHDITWDDHTEELYHYHVTKDYPYTVGCFHAEPVLTEL